MPDLRKVTDITDFTDGTYKDHHIKGVYCLVGYEEGRNENGDVHSYKYDLMGLPFVDDSGNVHFTIIDYDENKHKDFLYIDYNFLNDRDDGGYRVRKDQKTKNIEQKKLATALEDGSTTLSKHYIKNNEGPSSKKRKISSQSGGKTRKKKC